MQSISRDAEGLRDPRFFFYSDKLEFLASKPVPNYNFDPRTRPWFKEAIARMDATIPLRRSNDPDDIAHMAVFLASDEARNITGQSFNVDGGIMWD